MFERLWGWIGLAVMMLFAIPYPLLLLGLPLDYAWPIALFASAVMFIARPGGTVENLVAALFAYGMVFSLWAVAGTVAVLALGSIIEGIRPPLSLLLIGAVGIVGVIREALKKPPPNSSRQP